jgi:hypothetical protein
VHGSEVEASLKRIVPEHVGIIPFRDIETPELLAIKPTRSKGEYCWTLTPFIFTAVFERAPEAARVTYLDADLFFFDSPSKLLSELDACGKTVLITDHAYDPAYDYSRQCGRFCVQFLTFGRDAESLRINRWWQERCLEWCFDRAEDGKFGDQKYLDSWPEQFGKTVHVLENTQLTLGPWNARMFTRRFGGLKPVFYHFHGFRPIGRGRARIFMGYRIGSDGLRFYDAYLKAFSESWRRLRSLGIEPKVFSLKSGRSQFLRELVRMYVKRTLRYARIAA